MTDTKIWELTEGQLAECITFARDKWIASTTPEEGREWREAMQAFVAEQRHRMDLMLNDETNAVKLDIERKRFEAEKQQQANALMFEQQQQKTQNGFRIVELLITAIGAGTTIISAILGYKGRMVESTVKANAWNNICNLDRNGEIPLQQANKFIKW